MPIVTMYSDFVSVHTHMHAQKVNSNTSSCMWQGQKCFLPVTNVLKITADGDFEVENITQLRNISIKETEVRLDPITIHDDIFPEGAETFFLYLSKGENAETLNIFTITTPAMMIIDDDDGMNNIGIIIGLVLCINTSIINSHERGLA